jgi:hypothetical protein
MACDILNDVLLLVLCENRTKLELLNTIVSPDIVISKLMIENPTI